MTGMFQWQQLQYRASFRVCFKFAISFCVGECIAIFDEIWQIIAEITLRGHPRSSNVKHYIFYNFAISRKRRDGTDGRCVLCNT